MKLIKIAIVGAVVVGLSTLAYGQGGRRGRNYNPATETTVNGTVDEVKHLPSPGRGGGGVHLVLNAPSGPIDVHVGPAWFAAEKGFAFARGDALTVLGSKVTMGGADVLIARQITKGDQVLTLRDAQGFPLWSGRAKTPAS